MEQEAATRFQQLDQEHQQIKRSQAEAHERNRQQCLKDLDQIRQEAARLQAETQSEAERVRQEALAFRQSTQQQAESLMQRSRQEASTVQQGANRYAEQVLGELDSRLQELAKVVIGGRRELIRLQSTDVEVSEPSAESKTVSINRNRRSGGRFKEAAGGKR